MEDIETYVNNNLHRVAKSAEKYKNKFDHQLSYDDLFQAGILGLMKAYKLNSAFIKQYIENEIIDEIVKYGYRNPISHKLFKEYQSLLKTNEVQDQNQLSSKEKYDILVSNFQNSDIYLGYYLANINYHFGKPFNLDKCYYNHFIEQEVFLIQLREVFEHQLSNRELFTDDEALAIRVLYGFDDGIIKKYKEASEIVNITPSMLRSLESRAFRIFRDSEETEILKEYYRDWKSVYYFSNT